MSSPGSASTSDSLTDELLESAQNMDRPALETIVRTFHPRVCRICCALCGLESAGRLLARSITAQSLSAMKGWRNVAEADHWYLHHTILQCREIAPKFYNSGKDCLILRVNHPAGPYLAFIRAFRNLPPQQQEAFLLARCEHMDSRSLGVGMDCSKTAATNHLTAAEATLSSIAGAEYAGQLNQLLGVYASLTPTDEMLLDDTAFAERKLGNRQRWQRIVQILLLGLLGIIGWVVWRFSKMIVY